MRIATCKIPIVQTGGGGLQILFRHHVGLRVNAGIIGEGLDIRADGNYVVAFSGKSNRIVKINHSTAAQTSKRNY